MSEDAEITLVVLNSCWGGFIRRVNVLCAEATSLEAVSMMFLQTTLWLDLSLNMLMDSALSDRVRRHCF